jgi:hypothetical protein
MIQEYLDQLGTILKRVSFQNATDPTGTMRLLIAKIYVRVLDFLERLVEFSGVTPYGKFTILCPCEKVLIRHSQGPCSFQAGRQKGI